MENAHVSDHGPSGPSAGEKFGAAFIVISGFVALLIAIVLFHSPESIFGMVLGGVLAIPIITSITVFFHRGLTHQAVKFNDWVQTIGVLVAFAAWQGKWKKWVATHRKHHHFSDRPGDPHSPHLEGNGFLGMCRGLVHAHFGWLFTEKKPDYEHYIPDLLKNKRLVALDKWFLPVAIFSLILPGIIEFVFIPTFKGFQMGVLWGGFVRMFFVHHLTWSVNSICHFWGTRPFRSNDESVNNFIFGIFGFGEGWHRNHHAFRTSARIGLRWWEIDIGWYVIYVLKLLGLATEV
ncbi:MAG: fatty acid desaturase, partial [Patescibacteria group bacterium]